MFKSTCLETMIRFAAVAVNVFVPEYLRAPNAEDTTRLKVLGESRGFLGMDYMHWRLTTRAWPYA